MSSIFLNLDDNHFKVLESIHYATERDHCPAYKYLSKETGIERPELEKIIKVLKAWNYVETYRGLMDEEGKVAGSGFGIVPSKRDEVLLGVEWWDRRPCYHRDPETVTIHEIEYKLEKMGDK